MRALAIVVLSWMAFSVAAETARPVGWADLSPGFDPRMNPYYGLDHRQSLLLGKLVELEERVAGGSPLAPRDRRGRDLALTALASNGHDGVELARMARDFSDVLASSRTDASEGLDGRRVRISGFVLPLAIREGQITRFVLVPYAGACVHTPAPPSNQMIVVEATEGFRIRGPFEAITVVGRLSVSTASVTVPFIDGTSSLTASYALEAAAVETLRQSAREPDRGLQH